MMRGPGHRRKISIGDKVVLIREHGESIDEVQRGAVQTIQGRYYHIQLENNRTIVCMRRELKKTRVFT